MADQLYEVTLTNQGRRYTLAVRAVNQTVASATATRRYPQGVVVSVVQIARP